MSFELTQSGALGRRAGLRAGALAALALLLCVAFGGRASATTIVLTNGGVGASANSPGAFSDAFVTLVGPSFLLTNDNLLDSFGFFANPSPADGFLSVGQTVNLSGAASLVSPLDQMVFEGVAYRASGSVSVVAPSVAVPRFEAFAPFSLSGAIHGTRLGSSDTIDLVVVGSGTMTARFDQVFGDVVVLRSVGFHVEPSETPIPEPATVLLVGAGLIGAGFARRRREQRG
jgi:PEP-CTERM motif